MYSILIGYAQKKHSPLIEVNEFIDFFERYVKYHADEQSEWRGWSTGIRTKFWEELKRLTDAGRCILQEKGTRCLYLPKYCATLINNIYHADFNASESENENILPFPSEISLKVSLPPDSFIFIKVDELEAQLEAPPDEDAIINMGFPNSLGSILLLGSTISSNKLLEAAFVRVQYHLHKDLNYDFFQKKLGHHFHGREEYPRNMLNKLIQTPHEAADSLMEGEESIYLLWHFFCIELKHDLENKNMISNNESTVLQAVYIIEQFSSFYSKIAKKKKDKEHAFQELLGLLGRTPYLFKAGQITQFVGRDGQPLLLSHYSYEELFRFLDEISTAKEDRLPRFIVISGRKNTEQWYILKQKLPQTCVRYLLDAQPVLKNAIVDHWKDVLLDYETEEAMTDSSVFEVVLWRYLHSLIPPLAAMLEYKQIYKLYKEMDNSWEGYTEFVKLINKDTGKFHPLSTMLFLNQKNLLSEAKEQLPLLYSLPFIGKLIRFLRKKKKGSVQQSSYAQSIASKEVPVTIKSVFSRLEAALVPEGYTVEWYMTRLCEKWAGPFKDRNKKVDEVNRLVRNRIRRNTPLYKLSQINEEFLNGIAISLIEGSPTLKRLDQDSLKLYIKLYTLKLLRSMRRSGFKT